MWIKICGIQSLDVAQAIAASGANAIGLNFYQPSVRCVGLSAAREIVAAAADWFVSDESDPKQLDGDGEKTELIGLFVNHSICEISTILCETGIRSIQLHGDESPEFLADLQLELSAASDPLNVYRAFRIDAQQGCEPLAMYLKRCSELGVNIAGCFVDSYIPGEYGGTGHTAPWDLLADQYDLQSWPRLILAGGLTPANVAEAIQVTAPFGVDVASGVEREKGVKDLGLVQDFIEHARQANR